MKANCNYRLGLAGNRDLLVNQNQNPKLPDQSHSLVLLVGIQSRDFGEKVGGFKLKEEGGERNPEILHRNREFRSFLSCVYVAKTLSLPLPMSLFELPLPLSNQNYNKLRTKQKKQTNKKET